MDKIETILTNCIEEVKSGRATPSACLNRYPSRLKELTPLLRIALDIKQPPVITLDSSYKQIGKNRLLQQIAATQQNKSKTFPNILSSGPSLKFDWARIMVSIAIVVMTLSLLTGTAIYAAQDRLPGDSLYVIKRGFEDARLVLASEDSDKIKLHLEFAQIRLVEIEKLAYKNSEKMEFAVTGYRDSLKAAWQEIQGIQSTSTVELRKLYSETLKGYLTILDTISGNIPKEYHTRIEACRQVTEQFQKQADQNNQNQGESSISPQVPPSGKDNSTPATADTQNAPQNQDGSTNTGSNSGTGSSGSGNSGNSGNGSGSAGTGSSGSGSSGDSGAGSSNSGSSSGRK